MDWAWSKWYVRYTELTATQNSWKWWTSQEDVLRMISRSSGESPWLWLDEDNVVIRQYFKLDYKAQELET